MPAVLAATGTPPRSMRTYSRAATSRRWPPGGQPQRSCQFAYSGSANDVDQSVDAEPSREIDRFSPEGEAQLAAAEPLRQHRGRGHDQRLGAHAQQEAAGHQGLVIRAAAVRRRGDHADRRE